MIVARLGLFEEEEYFEVDESLRGDEGVPQVDFSAGSSAAPSPPSASSGAPADADGDGAADPPPPPV